MTDKEIIKALECCTNNEDCLNCPLQDDYANCNPIESALDLINRQQAEIEKWRYNLECVLKERADHSEAIKEFAERVKKYFNPDSSCDFREWLDNLVKEKVGEE